ncbi:MAG: AAA domain-containing protein, partial [Bacteroidota bacterium]
MNKELERLLELLKIEHQEDLEQYKLKIEKLPLHERKSKGFTWYPVNVGKQGYTIGDRAFVIVDRGNSEDEHQFRAGKTVRLFSELPAAKGYDKNGVIHYIDKNKMKIILNSKELPEWLSLGQVGVDLMFDETTYQEMEKALHKVMKATQGRISDLKRVILGKMDPYSLPRKEKVSIPKLNDSQNKAVNDILEAKDIAIVHGPPGTGKTTTLVQAIKLITKEEPTVLVAAPSNTAVDLLTERLANEGLVVVRIGNISRVDESILSHSLEVMVSKHPDSKNIKKLKKEAAESRRRANRYKRNFGRDQYLERQRLRQEANELMSWANQLEDRLIETILDHAQVITCTLVGSANKVLEKRKF